VERRQIGDLACNIDRLKTVASLAASDFAISAIDTSDPTVASAVTTARTGLNSAGEGIGKIALALVSGQQAPAAARTQVGQGLVDAQTALQGIAST
jgi:hypothetical protein